MESAAAARRRRTPAHRPRARRPAARQPDHRRRRLQRAARARAGARLGPPRHGRQSPASAGDARCVPAARSGSAQPLRWRPGPGAAPAAEAVPGAARWRSPANTATRRIAPALVELARAAVQERWHRGRLDCGGQRRAGRNRARAAGDLRPGDLVAVEDPSYTGVLDLLAAMGLVTEPVAIDDSGPTRGGFEALRSSLARRPSS